MVDGFHSITEALFWLLFLLFCHPSPDKGADLTVSSRLLPLLCHLLCTYILAILTAMAVEVTTMSPQKYLANTNHFKTNALHL